MTTTETDTVKKYRFELKRKLRIYLAVQVFAVAASIIPGAIIVFRQTEIVDRIDYGPNFYLAGSLFFGLMIAASAFAMMAVFFRKRVVRQAFVSFSSADRKFVSQLVGSLRSKDVNIVLAEDTIRVGDNIFERIKDLMGISSHVIVIVSDNYEKSQWAAIELGLIGRRVKVLPVVIGRPKMPAGLENIQYVHADKVSDDLIAALLPALPRVDSS